MKRYLKNWLVVMTASLAITACSGVKAPPDFAEILTAQGINPDQTALMIARLDDGETWSHGDTRLDERFVAASTSKIPHTFLALESGYVADGETVFEWDGTERWVETWNQDQTMATAYSRSAVWVFQNITASLGPEKMVAGLRMLNYGNKDTGGPEDVTTYWLTGPLKISAREQVQFLSNLHNEAFPLSQRTYAVGKSIMKAGRNDGRFAKTGWYYSDEETDIGWYVGWQEVPFDSGIETYVFAFNMDIEDRENDLPKRIAAVDAALSKVTGPTE